MQIICLYFRLAIRHLWLVLGGTLDWCGTSSAWRGATLRVSALGFDGGLNSSSLDSVAGVWFLMRCFFRWRTRWMPGRHFLLPVFFLRVRLLGVLENRGGRYVYISTWSQRGPCNHVDSNPKEKSLQGVLLISDTSHQRALCGVDRILSSEGQAVRGPSGHKPDWKCFGLTSFCLFFLHFTSWSRANWSRAWKVGSLTVEIVPIAKDLDLKKGDKNGYWWIWAFWSKPTKGTFLGKITTCQEASWGSLRGRGFHSHKGFGQSLFW